MLRRFRAVRPPSPDIAAELSRLRSIVEATVEGIAICEGDRVCEVNPSFAALVGRAPSELAGTRIAEWIRLQDGGALEPASLSPSAPARAVLRRPDGHAIPVEAVLRPIACPDRPRSLLSVWDLRARLSAERALQESEARYRLLADHASDIILLQTSLTKPARHVSPASRAVLGYEPNEMAGLDLIELIHPDDREAAMVAYAGLVPGGPPVTSLHRMRHKKGYWVWIEAVYDQSSSIGETDVVATLRDVTERQRQQHELEEARAKAEQAAGAKTDFLANMSHELRTPLTSLIGFAELLLETEVPPERRRQLLQLQLKAGRALQGLINDILDYAEIAAGRVTIETVPFSLPELVENCRSLVVEQAKQKGLRIESIVMAEMPDQHLGDPARIRQVLLNLLTNAIKFTDTGSVTIVIERSPKAADRVRLSVSDTGQGIPEAKLDGLFEQFTQVDTSSSRRFGGTGLGLAIAKGLVDLMQGVIGVESRLGAGSTFWVDIPLRTTRTNAAPSHAAPEAFNPLQWRVLVAEDTPLSQTLIASMLEGRGHKVTVVDNGQQAVEAIERETFDIVLMDIQMPVMDGLEATRTIRSREGSRRLPIIALTANALPADIDRSLGAGADVHLPKPIDWNSLDRTMERLITARYGGGPIARAS